MSAMRSAFLVVLLAGSAAGCASTPSSSSAYVPPRAASSGLREQDSEYVARINQQALKRGIHIEWVNPPLKHTPKPR